MADLALAEIEECRGDALFFAGEAGAAAHYQAARTALAPPGQQFSSLEESERCMEAHRRITGKLYAIDPYGKARPSHDCLPHPNYRPVPKPAEIAERKAAVVRLRQENEFRRSEMAKLFRDRGQWEWIGLGDRWKKAGEALATASPRGARRAFEWSLYYFELYNRAWTAHLPASRWDSDGGEAMSEVQGQMDSLADGPDESELPAWIDRLLAGDIQGALAAIGDGAAAWPAVAAVLDEAKTRMG